MIIPESEVVNRELAESEIVRVQLSEVIVLNSQIRSYLPERVTKICAAAAVDVPDIPELKAKCWRQLSHA